MSMYKIAIFCAGLTIRTKVGTKGLQIYPKSKLPEGNFDGEFFMPEFPINLQSFRKNKYKFWKVPIELDMCYLGEFSAILLFSFPTSFTEPPGMEEMKYKGNKF